MLNSDETFARAIRTAERLEKETAKQILEISTMSQNAEIQNQTIEDLKANIGDLKKELADSQK